MTKHETLLPLACALVLLAGCRGQTLDDASSDSASDPGSSTEVPRSAFVDDPPSAFRDSEPIGPTRALQITRPTRTAVQLIDRARAMAVVITRDESLPTGEAIDPSSLSHWEEAARSQPDRPGTINMYLEGHNLSATYLPATDTISVLSKDIIDRSPANFTPGDKAVGVGVEAAQSIAEACVDELAIRDAIPSRVYAREPIQAGERVTRIGDQVWVEQYDFVFAPKPGGMPLRSMDLRVGVAAQSGRCRSLTISMVEFEEADEVVAVTSADQARAFVEASVAADPLVESVSVEGYVGYLLEPSRSSARVEPRYIASYVTTAIVDDQSLVSREKTAAVSLTTQPQSLEPIYDW